MNRRVVALLAAVAIAGCAAPGPQPVLVSAPFVASVYDPYRVLGPNTVTGRAYIGGATCYGKTAALFPDSRYFREVVSIVAVGGKPETVPPDQRGTTPGSPVRQMKCDSQGNFILQRVPAGRWLLVAQVQTRMLQREVQITDGAVHQFDLTEANALR